MTVDQWRPRLAGTTTGGDSDEDDDDSESHEWGGRRRVRGRTGDTLGIGGRVSHESDDEADTGCEDEDDTEQRCPECDSPDVDDRPFECGECGHFFPTLKMNDRGGTDPVAIGLLTLAAGVGLLVLITGMLLVGGGV
jgi:hypothetical protein